VVADAPLTDMDGERFQRALDPKVHGAWNLHRRAAQLDLDFFVMFSSLASLLGSAGQANYMAGNAFMDALASQRRRLGTPTVSVSWAPWAGVGMAVEQDALGRLAALGIEAIERGQGLDALERLLAASTPHIGLGRIDWRRLLTATARPHQYTLLAEVLPDDADHEAARLAKAAELSRLAAREPARARDAFLTDLAERVTLLLGLTEGEQPALGPRLAETRLSELGLDSLAAMRLRDQFLTDFRVDVPPRLLLGDGTAADVAELLCRQITVRSLLVGDGETTDDQGETEVLIL
jgi:hypothetical protein